MLVCLLKYGAGVYPASDRMMALAQNMGNPHASPLLQPPDDFRLASPVSALLAGFLHLSGARAYLGVHLLLALGALCVPYAMAKVRRAPLLRTTITLLLIGGAIPAVLLNWVGGYDAVTIGAAAVAVLAEMTAVAALGWMLLRREATPRQWLFVMLRWNGPARLGSWVEPGPWSTGRCWLPVAGWGSPWPWLVASHRTM